MSATGEKMKEYGDRILAAGATGESKEEKLLKADLHREKAEGIAASGQERKYEERLTRQQKDLDLTEQKLNAAKDVSQQANLPDPKKVVDAQRENRMGETKVFNQVDPQSTTTTTRTVHSTTKTSGGI